MTPQTASIKKATSTAFASTAALLLAFALLLALAPPANAQDAPATATIGGAMCDGDNVEVMIMTTSGEEMLTENVTPEADGTWLAPLTIPAVPEPVIASAICFDGDVALVNYSPISLRVQPGVAVGGVIELPAQPIEGAMAADNAPETLPETGPFTVPFTALALAMIAAGTGMAFVSRQGRVLPAAVQSDDSTWPTSHWDS